MGHQWSGSTKPDLTPSGLQQLSLELERYARHGCLVLAGAGMLAFGCTVKAAAFCSVRPSTVTVLPPTLTCIPLTLACVQAARGEGQP